MISLTVGPLLTITCFIEGHPLLQNSQNKKFIHLFTSLKAVTCLKYLTEGDHYRQAPFLDYEQVAIPSEHLGLVAENLLLAS